MKLGQDVCFDISLKIIHGLVGVKRSQGQILEKTCLHSRGHVFGRIFRNLCQNVGIDDILVKFNQVWNRIKSRSQGQIFIVSQVRDLRPSWPLVKKTRALD